MTDRQLNRTDQLIYCTVASKCGLLCHSGIFKQNIKLIIFQIIKELI